MKKYIAPLSLAALLLAGCSQPVATDAPSVEPAGGESASSEIIEEATSEASETPVVSEPSPLPDETSATPTAEATPEGEMSPRGNVVLTPGEGTGIENGEGELQASFVVNSITVDAPCTSPDAELPENGHFVTLDVSVETTPAVGTDDGLSSFSMDPYNFKPIAANGTTSNADPSSIAAMYCYEEAQMLPSSIGPGEKATGLVVLDVESPSGILVFNDLFSMHGWEWAY